MGIEEQKEEREVLESIFPDEITDISDTEFRVAIVLDIENDNADADDDDAGPPTIILQVQYPESYPDEAPRLDISSPPNTKRRPDESTSVDVQADKAALLAALEPVVEENLGMAMVFTLVSSLKDAAEALVAERRAAAAKAKEADAARAEEEENRKFHGEAVTRESFLAWREGFLKEMREAEERKRAEDSAAEDKRRRGGGGPGAAGRDEGRLTGRQLWERGLAGRGEEDEDAPEAEAVNAVGAAAAKLKVQD